MTSPQTFISRNEVVLNFIKKMVVEKHGSQANDQLVKDETNNVYSRFENDLIKHFNSIIPDQKKQLLDHQERLVPESDILLFLMETIDGFELKMMQFLTSFRDNYLQTA